MSPRHKDTMFYIYIILLLALTLSSIFILLYNSHLDRLERQKELERMWQELDESARFRRDIREWLDKLNVAEMEATAYTHTGNQTYTGTWPKVGTVAVDPAVIPLGSRGYVVGYGPVRAEDTGGLIKGNIIDVFCETEAECWRWGRRGVTAIWLD